MNLYEIDEAILDCIDLENGDDMSIVCVAVIN